MPLWIKLASTAFTGSVCIYTVFNTAASNSSSFNSLVSNSPSDTELIAGLIKVDSPTELIESRPQNLALIRCSSSDKNKDIANWPICGVVGDVPIREQRTSFEPGSLLNRFRLAHPLSTEFIDEYGSSHDSQKWELVLLNLEEGNSNFVADDIVHFFSEWQDENKTIRDIEKEELSTNSPHLNRLYQAVNKWERDIGESPWDSSQAYVDRRILSINHGIPLFNTDEELIELAALETGKSPYTPVHYAVPASLSEYNSENATSYFYPEPDCEGASRQALLVHEPHQQLGQERAFFFLLSYLQEQYPSTFGELYIFQEGQPSHLNQSDAIFNLPVDGFNNEIISMLEASRNAWNSAFYSPLNSTSHALDNAIPSFLTGKRLSTEGMWDEALDFYRVREESGALDTRAAIQANLSTRNNEQSAALSYMHRLNKLKPHDIAFASTLVEKNAFRGALAYELFVEGNTSNTSDYSVSVYGLDDAGLYYASCALLPGCMSSSMNSSVSGQLTSRWKAIQPFRDWVMANTVVKELESLDPSAVPIVSAAAGTHLPLVRKFLCEAGISTVTLVPSASHAEMIGELTGDHLTTTKQWQPPTRWYGTTPIGRFLGYNLATPLRMPDIGFVDPSTGSGINQIITTWFTNPGMF